MSVLSFKELREQDKWIKNEKKSEEARGQGKTAKNGGVLWHDIIEISKF